MHSEKIMFHMRRMILATAILGLLGAVGVSPSVAAQETNDVAAQAQKEALDTWHKSLKQTPPPTEGCFHTTYPSVIWEKEACVPVAAHRVVLPPRFAKPAKHIQAESAPVATDTVGDGNDYNATTSSLTTSATGSFPSVKGVTAKGNYTLQLNTTIGSSSACNATYGYSSCSTWEQFIYGTTGEDVSGTPPQAYIQNWIFLSDDDYSSIGCPNGWGSYDPQDACYEDSAAVNTANVALANLGSVKLSGSASTKGNDTVIFTYGTTAKSVSQSGRTVSIGSIWKQSEFNVVGNGGGSGLSFNKGSSLTVNIQVADGTTTAPTCAGPTNGGTTGETNNLTLGKCTAKAGTAAKGTTAATNPSIQFTESN